jgi:hypothetical protein
VVVKYAKIVGTALGLDRCLGTKRLPDVLAGIAGGVPGALVANGVILGEPDANPAFPN